MIQLSLSVVLIIAIICSIVWLQRQRQQHHNLKLKRDQWIRETLSSISAEADRKRLHVHATSKIDVSRAFEDLRRLNESSPADIIDQITQMEVRWQELSSQIAEFSSQSNASTLQSSILSSRTSRLANEINRLAEEISQKLP